MNALQVLTILNAALELASNAGINLQKLHDLRAKAKAEHRAISYVELQSLARDAQAAIDKV